MNDADALMGKAREALAATFGFAEFRPGQEEVAARCSRRDVLAVMPTGSRKVVVLSTPGAARGALTWSYRP